MGSHVGQNTVMCTRFAHFCQPAARTDGQVADAVWSLETVSARLLPQAAVASTSATARSAVFSFAVRNVSSESPVRLVLRVRNGKYHRRQTANGCQTGPEHQTPDDGGT